ncbi:uncharacterized protein LOC117600209 [Osmia lignaria lignaria]|uniref:uncharacterized protein LOC117600209 n=1 Tax=Osmia lignaria lignaria TaxID=1437193 RepID=UPI001478EE6B|nr:uncharacterized protein DDB_G0280315-like [Osmia lignaria]
MKKSPLSMPSSSKPKQNYNWKVHDRKNRTGYNYIKSDNYQCTSPNQNSGNDFIPLNASSPLPERNWRGSRGRNHRNSGSGGFNHYRNNYHSTPKSNFNNLYSPYKHSGKQFYGQKKGYQKDARKQVDISNYIDRTSFLEDPWAELMKKLNDSKEVNDSEMSPTFEPLLSSESIYIDSKNELGLDDTDVSSVSRTESSIDINLENVTFGQELVNKSNGSNNDSVCEDFQENGVHSAPTTNVIQDLI